MRYRIFIALPLAGVLALTACVGDPAPTTSSESIAAAPSASASPTPTRTPIALTWLDFPERTVGEVQLSERGNIVKAVGEVAGYVDNETGASLARFLVQDIVDSGECATTEVVPENGRFVRVDIQAEVAPELAQAYERAGLPPELFFGTWDYIDPNGIKSNTSPFTLLSSQCLPPNEQLPMSVLPGERALGSIVLDVPAGPGTLVLSGSNAAWEFILS